MHDARTRLLIAILVSTWVGAGFGAVAVASAGHLLGDVHIEGTVSGQVTVVNGPGSAACITEDGSGDEICSDLLRMPGDPPVAVGQHITVTHVWIKGNDVFLVAPSEPLHTQSS